jgi:DNA-binding transcriptional regulator LsrR (DeoR family)
VPRTVPLAALQTVRIVGGVDAPELHVERVGGAELNQLAVLNQLAEDVRPGMTVGLSWSRTLDRAAHLLAALPSCTVVQLTGAFETTGGGTFRRLLAQLDRRSGITTYPLFAPLVVDRIETAQDIRRQPVVTDALARADSLDIAVVSIGAWRANESSVWEKVSPAMRTAAQKAGAVAEFSGLFIDKSGEAVSTPLDGRVIGVSLQQLQMARQVIGFATGVDREEAVREGIPVVSKMLSSSPTPLRRHEPLPAVMTALKRRFCVSAPAAPHGARIVKTCQGDEWRTGRALLTSWQVKRRSMTSSRSTTT